ncbi:MAG: hypothetical protein ABI572_06450 [Actinomycetota bacterium]
MQAPPKHPDTHDRDLIVIPEAHLPLPRWLAFAFAGAAAFALLLGALGMYVVSRGDLRDRDSRLAALVDRASSAEDRARLASAQITVLESRVADLRTVLTRSRARTVVVGASRTELRRQLADARRELDLARERIVALTVPSAGDGRHIASLVAVGATQSPPRIVVDFGRWFTGERARQAAIADGALDPGEVLPHGRYLRNDTPDWRTVPLDANAIITVRGWHRRAGISFLSLEELQRLMRSNRVWAERIRHDPFWVTVEGGRVTAIHEQRYP